MTNARIGCGRFHRFPTFYDGKLFMRDINDDAFVKIAYQSENVNKVFERDTRTTWLSDGEVKKHLDVLILLNYADRLYGNQSATIELSVNDPYSKNRRALKVQRTFRYRIIYSGKKEEGLVIKSAKPDARIEIVALDNDAVFKDLSCAGWDW